jgi:hypothetical protein
MLTELIETKSNVSAENMKQNWNAEMKKVSTIKLDKELYKHLDTVRMSPYERSMAIGAMRNAEAIIDAAAWIGKTFRAFTRWLSTRHVPAQPSFRH